MLTNESNRPEKVGFIFQIKHPLKVFYKTIQFRRSENTVADVSTSYIFSIFRQIKRSRMYVYLFVCCFSSWDERIKIIVLKDKKGPFERKLKGLVFLLGNQKDWRATSAPSTILFPQIYLVKTLRKSFCSA